MKKIILFLSISIALSAQLSAQKLIVSNGDERYGKTALTSDSSYHYIDSVNVTTNEGGVLEVTVIGFSYDTMHSVTGTQIVRYNKRAGTLTLGTPADVLAKATDASLGTATWDIVAANNKIYIRIKGKLTYTMRWLSVTKRKAVYQ